MSNEVTVKLKGDKRDLDKALGDSQQSVKGYATAVKAALAGIAAALAVRQIISFGSSMISLYNTQIAAETKLASVIRATGGVVGYTTDQLKKMASQMQEQIGIGDEVILNTMSIIATFRNIRGDTFKEATLAAYDMAAVLGGDASSNAIQLGKALNDPIAGITALSRAGVTFSIAQKDMIKALVETGDVAGAQRVILDELANEFGGAAADKAATFEGQLTKLWNTLGDVGEVIGGALVPYIATLFPVIEMAGSLIGKLVGSLADAGTASQEFQTSWSAYFVDTLKWGISIATDAFSTMEFLFTNFGNIVERTTYSWLLTFVSAFEELKHWFTEVVPAYLEWFANNFVRIFQDLAAFEATVFNNMIVNIGQFFGALQSWLRGDPKDFEFVALSEGFQSTLDALPEIAGRGISDTEKMLKQSINAMDETIGKSMNDIFSKNQKFVDGLMKGDNAIEPEIKPDFDPAVIEVKKAEEKVKKEGKLASDKVKSEVDKMPGNVGSSIGIDALAKDIQTAAIKGAIGEANQADIGARSFEFDGAQKAELGVGGEKKAEAAVVGAVAESAAKTNLTLADVIKVLTEIKTGMDEKHPQVLKALGLAGGTV